MEAVSAPTLALPRVSAIVTCFNYAGFVTDALDSVVAQTYSNWECVVVDDASTDNSVEVIERWIADAKDARFRLIRCPSNQGQLAAIGQGLRASDSEFVAMLDADDFWFPQFLQRHIEVHLNCSGAVAATCSDVIQIDGKRRFLSGVFVARKLFADNEQTKASLLPIPEEAMVSLDPDTSLWQLPGATRLAYVRPDILSWHWTVSTAMVFRRPMLELVFPKSPEGMRIGSDPYLMQMCHYFGSSIVFDQILGAYRRHGRNTFSNQANFGASVFSRFQDGKALLDSAVAMELQHLLDRFDDFASLFGAPTTSKLVRALFRYSLGQGQSIDDPRIRRILGPSRYFRDRLRDAFRRLRGRPYRPPGARR